MNMDADLQEYEQHLLVRILDGEGDTTEKWTMKKILARKKKGALFLSEETGNPMNDEALMKLAKKGSKFEVSRQERVTVGKAVSKAKKAQVTEIKPKTGG